jgi:hypothetical protein
MYGVKHTRKIKTELKSDERFQVTTLIQLLNSILIRVMCLIPIEYISIDKISYVQI